MVLGQTFREVATPIHRLEPMASINCPPSGPWQRAHQGLALPTPHPRVGAMSRRSRRQVLKEAFSAVVTTSS